MGQGRLVGIAQRAKPRAPMETLASTVVTTDHGVGSDHRGKLKPGGRGKRQVTILSREAWEAACAEIGASVPWTVRRANLLVEGVVLPTRAGQVVQIGGVRLLVTGECDPCRRMDEAVPGLEIALTPDWRGGLTCKVLAGGEIAIGDSVDLVDERILEEV